MIRCEQDNGVWLFTQTSHAFMCGQIARHWQHDLNPYDEMLLAASVHDAGWLERDTLPQINTDGKPRTFTELDLDDHFTVWERSIQRVSASNLYAGLMVSLHATNLYQRRLKGGRDSEADAARIRQFVAEKTQQQEATQAALAPYYLVQTEHLEQNRESLQAWDWMSLLLCMGKKQDAHTIPCGDGQTIQLELDEAGVLHVSSGILMTPTISLYAEGRWLDRQIFTSDAELQQAYYAATPEMRSFKVVT